MDSWLRTACDRLEKAGYVLLDDVRGDGGDFAVVARRSRFEFTKFGYSENFFIFAEFDRLDRRAMRDFGEAAFHCAKANKKCFLPCGLFESVWCYTVAVADSVDRATLEAVKNESPPKHWAAAEVPVIYNRGTGELAYFEKTPMWGAAYYAGFRKQIKAILDGIPRD